MTTALHYIEVAVILPVHGTFTYAVADHLAILASPGKRVFIPFRQRQVTGYILGAVQHTAQYQIKMVLDIPDETPFFPASMIPFFRWIAAYYCYPIGEVINTALPRGVNEYASTMIKITPTGVAALKKDSLTPLQKKIASLLTKHSLPLKKLQNELKQNTPRSLINTMEKQGWLEKRQERRGGTARPKTERWVKLIRSDIPDDRFRPIRKKIINILEFHREITLKQLKKSASEALGSLNYLKKNGYIEMFDKTVYRDPFGETVTRDNAPQLTAEQKEAVKTVMRVLGRGFTSFLLAGVTGSGKTEVYMHLAAQVLKRGACVLVLVPEIALISQAVRRFRARFGQQVAVLHSGLSTGERYDQHKRILSNKASIVIGARSAIFAPFDRIGLVIVDEEHDPSYKQDNGLHYNGRDLALVLAKQHGAVAILGSATPSVQSCYNAVIKKFEKICLTERIEKRPLPRITIVDLRQSRDLRGIRRFITVELHQAMSATLERQEQVLLFLNRRGFASNSVCSACGEVLQCQNCDISLTFHKNSAAFQCHYCGFKLPAGTRCPTCGSSGLQLLGYGTEKVEEAVKTFFPLARVARLDRDTTARKGSLLKILQGLHERTIDILIGTQMVAKGHDFPYITLVGIICADLSLSVPDFRAGERTFQILAQVAGRAGRGASPGKVILQTYNPKHFSILAAQNQDYEAFHCQEIKFRQDLNYPPFSRLIQLKIAGKNPQKTAQTARHCGDVCYRLQNADDSFMKRIEILGPIEAPLARLEKRHRWQILLKGLDSESLHRFVNRLLAENRALFYNKEVKVIIDVDPVFLM